LQEHGNAGGDEEEGKAEGGSLDREKIGVPSSGDDGLREALLAVIWDGVMVLNVDDPAVEGVVGAVADSVKNLLQVPSLVAGILGIDEEGGKEAGVPLRVIACQGIIDPVVALQVFCDHDLSWKLLVDHVVDLLH